MANVEENRQQLRAIASSEESKNGEYTEGSRKKMTKEEDFYNFIKEGNGYLCGRRRGPVIIRDSD